VGQSSNNLLGKKQHFKGKLLCKLCPPTKAQLGRFIPTTKTQKSLVNCPHSRALISGSTKILYCNETKKKHTKGKGKRQFKEKNMGIQRESLLA
jgi:hypothetical protein